MSIVDKIRDHLSIFGLMIVGAAAFYIGTCMGDSVQPEYADVVVPDTVIVRGKPDTIIKWRERIRWREAEPEQLAVAPGAAADDIAGFCESAGYQIPVAMAEAPDSSSAVRAPPRPIIEVNPNPRLLLDAFTFEDGVLKAWGPRTDRSLWQGTFEVRPPLRAVVSGGQLHVQGSRWWWVGELAPFALCGAGAWASVKLDGWLPAAAGCGVGVFIALH